MSTLNENKTINSKFDKKVWISNYINNMKNKLKNTIIQTQEQIKLILEKSWFWELLECHIRYDIKKHNSSSAIYDISDIKDYHIPQNYIERIIDSLIIIYWEKRLQNLMIKITEIDNDAIKRILLKINFKFIWDICILSFSQLETKLIKWFFWEKTENWEQEDTINELMIQIQYILWEYNLSLWMSVPEWDIFKPIE